MMAQNIRIDLVRNNKFSFIIYNRQMKNKKRLPSHQEQIKQLSCPKSPFQNLNNSKINVSAEFDPVYDFQVCVEIGDGRSDTIYLNEKSDPNEEAAKFCRKYKLDNNVAMLLAQSLSEQAKKQRNMARSMYDQNQKTTEIYEQAEESLEQLNANKTICTTQKIVPMNHRSYAWNKGSQQIWKQKQSPKGYPKINDVSKQIVNKAGKSTILNYMARKSSDKIQQHIYEKLQSEARELEHYSFHPVINPISEEVDKTLRTISRGEITRYDQLYEYQKLYKHRLEERKRNSIKQLSFKPQINTLSKQIMNRKKSEQSLFSGQKKLNVKHGGQNRAQFDSTSAQRGVKQFFNTSEQKYQKNKKQGKSTSKSRGKSTQFSNHLYQQAKKRQEKAKKEEERLYKEQENWKIIDHSNEMITQLRQQRIRDIFKNLTSPPHQELTIHDIKQEHLDNVEKLFLPIFNQMKQLQTELNEEEFVQAGMRLLHYLSPLERALLIRKKQGKNTDKIENKENQNACMNEKSRSIVKGKKYGEYSDIYIRGLMHKREVKEQIQKGKQEQVRRELQDCTFKPRINYVPETCGY